MKITAIKQQVKNQARASIFLDGKYSFSLTLDQLVVEKLKVGLELEEPRLKELKKKSDEGKFRQRAMEWVLSRPRSVKEFKDYLRLRKIEEDFSNELIESFMGRGYLSDENFAKWWVSRRVLRSKSQKYIRNSLRAKGVNQEILNMLSISEGEDTRLKELISTIRTRPRYQDETKLKAYLLRQGFSYDDIRNAL